MRAIFGLVGLLVTVGIIVYIAGQNASTVVKTGKDATDKTNQIAGRDTQGVPFDKSFQCDVVESGGQTQYVLLTSVVAGGAMDKTYGAKPKDRIIRAAIYNLKGDLLPQNTIQNAYRAGQELAVLRDGSPDPIVLPFRTGSK